jgi:hypothetical protein
VAAGSAISITREPDFLRQPPYSEVDQTYVFYEQTHPSLELQLAAQIRASVWSFRVSPQSNTGLAPADTLRSPQYDSPDLLFEHFFDLSDLFLNFACVFFGDAFGLQVRILRHFADRLFDSALHFMKCAFNLVLRARIHLSSF